jgi:hypothetical protein
MDCSQASITFGSQRVWGVKERQGGEEERLRERETDRQRQRQRQRQRERERELYFLNEQGLAN